MVIGNNSHVSTRATLNGEVKLGYNSFVGSYTVIKQSVKIGNNTFINAGLFIDKNIKDNTKIYEKNKTLIIAEIGVNHNGKINLAKKLINIAKS